MDHEKEGRDEPQSHIRVNFEFHRLSSFTQPILLMVLLFDFMMSRIDFSSKLYAGFEFVEKVQLDRRFGDLFLVYQDKMRKEMSVG